MVMGTGVKTAMFAWMFFKRVLMIAITVVGLLCGLAVFRRDRRGVGCGGSCVRWAGLGQIRAAAGVELVGSLYAWALSRLHGLLIIALLLKYELMCETTF